MNQSLPFSKFPRWFKRICLNTPVAFYYTRRHLTPRWPGPSSFLAWHPSAVTHATALAHSSLSSAPQATKPMPASGPWNRLLPLTLIPRPPGRLLPPEGGLPCPSYRESPFPHPMLNCSVILSCFNFLRIFEIILFICLLLPRPPRM